MSMLPNGQGLQPTRDHVLPRSRYRRLPRSHAINNTVQVCRRCNQDKGSLTLREWHVELRAKHDQRAKIVTAVIEERASKGWPS